MTSDDLAIIEKYCAGSRREKEEAVKMLIDRLIPKATRFMWNNQGKDKEELMKDVAWNGISGRNKLLDRLCSGVNSSIEAYYMETVRRDWIRALGRLSQPVEAEPEASGGNPVSRADLVDLLSLIQLLKGLYQAPVLISALGYNYMDIQEDYDEIKQKAAEVLESYGLKPEAFEFDGDIRDISYDVFRQRLSQGRQRLKRLYYRR